MSYNLNFYPNDLNNTYTPYGAMYNNNFDFKLQQMQQNASDRLNQVQELTNQLVQPMQQSNNTQQPYYLFCGNKREWDEFLILNYGITENDIFNDYKVFLQAKQELADEQGQNRIDTMKNKLRNKGRNKRFENVDSSVKSNVKPVVGRTDFNGNSNNPTNRGDIQYSNGLVDTNKQQSKNTNRQT